MVLEQLSEDCEQSEKMISSLRTGSPGWVFPKAPPSFIKLRKSSKTGFVIFLATFTALLSFVVIGLFNNHLKFQEDNAASPSRRIQDLVNLLRQAEDKQESLEKEVLKLRTLSASSKFAANAPGTHNPEIHNKAWRDITSDPDYQKLSVLAGLTPQSGQGILVMLNDMKSSEKDRVSAESHNRLQSDDLLKLVNELKAAGASAISINNQRIVSSTAIVNAGPSILVNQTRLSSPIYIKAIGNPTILKASLLIHGGILEYLQFFGIQTDVEEKPQVTVPAYTGPV